MATKTKWVSTVEARKLLGVSRPTLWKWLKRTDVEVRHGRVDGRERFIDLREFRRKMRELDRI